MPLAKAVVEMAAAAALKGHRFKPVRAGELADLEIEISVLSQPRPIRPDQVRVGVDGLMINQSGRLGLLLPQVPLDMGWDREEYLDGLCYKAGLPSGAWRNPGAKLLAFEAEAF